MQSCRLQKLSLDEALDKIQNGIARLSRPKMAVFFATCADTLLPLYDEFFVTNQWGDPQGLRRVIRAACQYAAGVGDIPAAQDMGDMVQKATPDGDKFDAPESTFAQDVAICVDVALRAISRGAEFDPAWIELRA